MYLQTLFLAAVMVIVSGLMLLTSLVTAKASLHRAAAQHVTLSLVRGTRELVSWAGGYVQVHGADSTTWPSTSHVDSPNVVCVSGAGSGVCPLVENVSYAITGTSMNSNGTGSDVATNLQLALHENRFAAQITATVTDRAGAVFSSRTREVTVRIFDAPPYAIVAGERDVTTNLGGVMSVHEGDTGGVYRKQSSLFGAASPSPADPAAYKDTTIRVTMTCQNSLENSDSDPFNDNHTPGNSGLPFGVQAKTAAYETPCKVNQNQLSSAYPLPDDAVIPSDGDFNVDSFESPARWSSSKPIPSTSW